MKPREFRSHRRCGERMYCETENGGCEEERGIWVGERRFAVHEGSGEVLEGDVGDGYLGKVEEGAEEQEEG